MRNNREKYLIIGAAIFIIAAVAYVFWPSSAGRKTDLVPLSEAQGKTATAKIDSRKMEEEQKILEPRIEKMAYNTRAEDLVPQIVRDLQDMAEKSGIHLREVKPLRALPLIETKETGTARNKKQTHTTLGAKIPIELHFRAAFQPDVIRFLYHLEDPSGRIVVDKVNINSADSKFKTVEVSAQITVFTRSTAGVVGADEGDTSNGQANPI